MSFDDPEVVGKAKLSLALNYEETDGPSLRLAVTNTGETSRFVARVIRCVGAGGVPRVPWDLQWRETGKASPSPSVKLGRNETAHIELARRLERQGEANGPDPGRELFFPWGGGGRRVAATSQEVELTVVFDGADYACQLEAEVWIRTRADDSLPSILAVRSRHVVRTAETAGPSDELELDSFEPQGTRLSVETDPIIIKGTQGDVQSEATMITLTARQDLPQPLKLRIEITPGINDISVGGSTAQGKRVQWDREMRPGAAIVVVSEPMLTVGDQITMIVDGVERLPRVPRIEIAKP